jgi:Undecaprenyl-phosphate galactose phosphotransferase WbaP
MLKSKADELLIKHAAVGFRFPAIPLILSFGRAWSTFVLICSDLFSLLLAGSLAILLRLMIGYGFQDYSQYINLTPIIGLFIVVYALNKLYPAFGVHVIDELQKISISTSVVFLLIIAATYWAKVSIFYSRILLTVFWILSLILVPCFRGFFRSFAIKMGIWGEPVALIGFGLQGKKLNQYLKTNPQLGFLPVIGIDENLEQKYGDFPVLKPDTILNDPDFFTRLRIQTAILSLPEVPDFFKHELFVEKKYGLHRLVIISDFHGVAGSAVNLLDLHGILGLEIEKNLLNPWEQFIKRVMEIMIVFVAGLVFLPFFLLIVGAILIDSRGKVFYGHKRVGRGGKEFTMWKFRTMVSNADQVLSDYLKTNPGKEEEWKSTSKIKEDPRITRVGKFLRRTSLDEIPQLWNVLKSEMSLVGPRPIIQREIVKYEKVYRLYTQVSPGMTGIWQVSGRNNLKYEDRVGLDEYYIRHWSIWMDIYILAKTIPTAVSGKGAY